MDKQIQNGPTWVQWNPNMIGPKWVQWNPKDGSNWVHWNTNYWSRLYSYRYFRYFVVIDFEATCDKVQVPQQKEIIEFPAVLVDGITGNILAGFQTYVRPILNPKLSDFCKKLTGIQQTQVDYAMNLQEAILQHDFWLESLGIKKTDFAVVTWSSCDCRDLLELECKYKMINKPSYFNRWIDLRVPFSKMYGLNCSLMKAAEIAGLNWTGRAHSGFDDATNTALLLSVLMNAGADLSITDTLS